MRSCCSLCSLETAVRPVHFALTFFVFFVLLFSESSGKEWIGEREIWNRVCLLSLPSVEQGMALQ